MDGIVTEAAQQFLTQGILGVIVVVLAVAVVLLYRENKACAEQLRDETRAVTKALEDSSRVVAAMTLALESNNRVMEARTRASELIAAEVEKLRLQHNNDIEWVREKLQELRRGAS